MGETSCDNFDVNGWNDPDAVVLVVGRWIGKLLCDRRRMPTKK
jgi:hypothetical protein